MNVALATILLCSNPYRVDQGYAVEVPYTVQVVPACAAPARQAEPGLRLLLVSSKGCGGCVAVENVLNSPWMNSEWAQRGLLTTTRDRDAADRYNIEMFPTWILLQENKEVGRVTPTVDDWDSKKFVMLGLTLFTCRSNGDFKELRKQPRPPVVKGRVAFASAGYPLRSNWWTGCSHWTHLTVGPHAGKFNPDWLRSLSWAELQSLHSDDHEGRVHWQFVNR